MPIRPENKKLYPANWKEIREEIKLRANDCCELCGVMNHDHGFRNDTGKFVSVVSKFHHEIPDNVKIIRIVCTVMHLNHDPTDNGEPGNRPNLKFGCQKCHNNYDAKFRAENRKKNKQTLGVSIESTV
jgi:hypothetical protein